jgi:hypothetical protein
MTGMGGKRSLRTKGIRSPWTANNRNTPLHSSARRQGREPSLPTVDSFRCVQQSCRRHRLAKVQFPSRVVQVHRLTETSHWACRPKRYRVVGTLPRLMNTHGEGLQPRRLSIGHPFRSSLQGCGADRIYSQGDRKARCSWQQPGEGKVGPASCRQFTLRSNDRNGSFMAVKGGNRSLGQWPDRW